MRTVLECVVCGSRTGERVTIAGVGDETPLCAGCRPRFLANPLAYLGAHMASDERMPEARTERRRPAVRTDALEELLQEREADEELEDERAGYRSWLRDAPVEELSPARAKKTRRRRVRLFPPNALRSP